MRHLIRLFYVEHFFFSSKKLFVATVLAVFSLFFASCNKRDSNPEGKDPVYAQLNKDIDVARSDLLAKKSEIDSIQSDLRNAVPQSGEARVYEKRLNIAVEAKIYLAQRLRMYEVRAEERKIFVQKKYLESLLPSGKKWPDAAESESELLKLRMLREKSDRMRSAEKPAEESVPRGTTPAAENTGH